MIEEFLFNYCPWLQRVWLILCWLFAIVQDQVNPGLHKFLYYPTHLWPGWDWAQMNAIYSGRHSPWQRSGFAVVGFYYSDDDDDDDDAQCSEDWL